jgi:voltage-gated potassium channel
MNARSAPRAVDAQARSRRIRGRLQSEILDWVEIPLAVLALVMLVLIVSEYLFGIPDPWLARVHDAEAAIWVIFVADFVVELALAPSKSRYLRCHWISAVAVIIPPLRGIRIVRVAAVLRGVSLIRVVTVLERGARALDQIARRGRLAYVVALMTVIAIIAAAGGYFFEHREPTALIRSPGDALWWSFTLITTMNSGLEAVTLPGRVIGFVMRLFAPGVSGYLTAVIAAFLVRSGARSRDADRELGKIRHELTQLRAAIERQQQLGGRTARWS